MAAATPPISTPQQSYHCLDHVGQDVRLTSYAGNGSLSSRSKRGNTDAASPRNGVGGGFRLDNGLDLIERLALAILIPNAVIEEVRAGRDKDRAAGAARWTGRAGTESRT